MIKGTVPFFNETIDLSNPSGAGKTFVGMVLGGVGLIAALAVANSVWGAAQDTAGQSHELPTF